MSEPTKAELMEQAEGMGLDVDDSMTKAQIQELIDGASDGQPVEETEGDPDAPKVCARCGEPATFVSSSEAYSAAYYCDKHSTEAQRSGEGTKPLNPKNE